MHFHENRVDSDRCSGARQRRDKFALTSGTFATGTGKLHRVGRIEHHWVTELAHYNQRAHIADQIVVAERETSLGQ